MGFKKRNSHFSLENSNLFECFRQREGWSCGSYPPLCFLSDTALCIYFGFHGSIFILSLPPVQFWSDLSHSSDQQSTRAPPRNPINIDLLGRCGTAVKIPASDPNVQLASMHGTVTPRRARRLHTQHQ